MNQIEKMREELLKTFEEKGYAQVRGYNSFDYLSRTDTYVLVSRETGKDTKIYFNKLDVAINAVCIDNDVYNNGPSTLRAYGITHVNSPIWAILHLKQMGFYAIDNKYIKEQKSNLNSEIKSKHNSRPLGGHNLTKLTKYELIKRLMGREFWYDGDKFHAEGRFIKNKTDFLFSFKAQRRIRLKRFTKLELIDFLENSWYYK